MLAEIGSMRMNCPAFLQNIGAWEWVIIALVVLLLFGGKKLPELARGLARGLRIFKEELNGTKKSIEEPPKDDDAAKKDEPADKGDKPKNS